MRTRDSQTEVILLTFSQDVYGYFPHIIVLSCIKLIRSESLSTNVKYRDAKNFF